MGQRRGMCAPTQPRTPCPCTRPRAGRAAGDVNWRAGSSTPRVLLKRTHSRAFCFFFLSSHQKGRRVLAALPSIPLRSPSMMSSSAIASVCGACECVWRGAVAVRSKEETPKK